MKQFTPERRENVNKAEKRMCSAQKKRVVIIDPE